jgi:hypothetical protein
VDRVARSTNRIRDHSDAQKWAFELQFCRAAYRNRTDDLRITRVFSCVACRFGARPSFMFAGCCWRQSLVIDGGSGTSRGHGSVMCRPGLRRPMAVVTCGTAGWPSVSYLFRVRSPLQPGSRATRQVTMPAVLSGSDRDNPQSTTSSGTRRARSRLRRACPFKSPAKTNARKQAIPERCGSAGDMGRLVQVE